MAFATASPRTDLTGPTGAFEAARIDFLCPFCQLEQCFHLGFLAHTTNPSNTFVARAVFTIRIPGLLRESFARFAHPANGTLSPLPPHAFDTISFIRTPIPM